MTKYTPFNLVHGREAVILVEFLIPSLLATQATRMGKEESIKTWLEELMALNEERFLAQHH